MTRLIRFLGAPATRGGTTYGWSTPRPSSAGVPGRPPSALTLWAGPVYGYCASHTRYFWGLRLHVISTPPACRSLLPSPPKDDERDIAWHILNIDPALLARCEGQILMADKGYRSEEFDRQMAALGITVVRPQ